MNYLTDVQPIRTGASAVYPYTLGLEELFTIYPKFSEPYSVAVKVGNSLHVPRECVPIGVEDHRVKKPRLAINCKVGPRNDDQKSVISRSIALLESGQNHVIEAPTGFGKTYCGSSIAAHMGQPTLIIVTKEDLVVSWRKALINLIGIPADQIGHLQGSVEKWKGCRFVIGMVHSLIIPDKFTPDMFSYFGMVIFDEVHRMAADSFSQACMLFPAIYRLGLSATPDRADGKWAVVEYSIGPVMVKGKIIPMKPKILVKKTGWKIPMVTRFEQGAYIKKKLEYAPGRMAGVFKAMGKDSDRNDLIGEFVKSAYAAGRTTVVMAELIDNQLVPLFHTIAKYGVPAEEIDYYIGGRKEIELDIAAKKKVVLATYKMCSEGTDKPWWDTLVLVHPRTDVKQTIGRVMRELEGKKEPVVLDLVDHDSVFSTFYNKREKQYFEVGATIVKL